MFRFRSEISKCRETSMKMTGVSNTFAEKRDREKDLEKYGTFLLCWFVSNPRPSSVKLVQNAPLPVLPNLTGTRLVTST